MANKVGPNGRPITRAIQQRRQWGQHPKGKKAERERRPKPVAVGGGTVNSAVMVRANT